MLHGWNPSLQSHSFKLSYPLLLWAYCRFQTFLGRSKPSVRPSTSFLLLYNKSPKTYGLKQHKLILIFLEVRSLKWVSKAALSLEAVGKNPFLAFFNFQGLPAFLGSWPLPPLWKPQQGIFQSLSLSLCCHHHITSSDSASFSTSPSLPLTS